MTTYNIYFINKYSVGDNTQDYAFFCDAPTVSSSAGKATAYSNVLLGTNLARDGNWSIDITQSYYAWCGTAPQKLAPGVVVSRGMGKLATLGTDSAPGSTFSMYNNSGNPAFKSAVAYTAGPSSFEIDTGTDFNQDMNFLIGMGATDPVGKMKPVATIAAPGNAETTITPVTKFWIAASGATVGTAMNTSSVSKNAGFVDFTSHPGMFSAVVS